MAVEIVVFPHGPTVESLGVVARIGVHLPPFVELHLRDLAVGVHAVDGHLHRIDEGLQRADEKPRVGLSRLPLAQFLPVGELLIHILLAERIAQRTVGLRFREDVPFGERRGIGVAEARQIAVVHVLVAVGHGRPRAVGSDAERRVVERKGRTRILIAIGRTVGRIGLVGHLVERFAVELVFVVTVEHHAVAFERLQRLAAVMDTVFEIGLRLVVLSREEARLGPESLGRPDGHAVVVGLREKPHGPVQIVDDGLVAGARLRASDVHLLQRPGNLVDDGNAHAVHVGLTVKRQHVPPVEGPEKETFAFVIVQRCRLGRRSGGPVGVDLLHGRIGVVDTHAERRPGVRHLVVAGLHGAGANIDPSLIVVPLEVDGVVEAVHDVSGPVVAQKTPMVLGAVDRVHQQVDVPDRRGEIALGERIGIVQVEVIRTGDRQCRTTGEGGDSKICNQFFHGRETVKSSCRVRTRSSWSADRCCRNRCRRRSWSSSRIRGRGPRNR